MAALTSTPPRFDEPSNLLGIPEDHYGRVGIEIGNSIHESISLSGKGLETSYDVSSRKIVVLNSSELPLDELLKILGKTQYDDYIVIDPKKDSSSNFQIGFKDIVSGMIRPQSEDPFIFSLRLDGNAENSKMAMWEYTGRSTQKIANKIFKPAKVDKNAISNTVHIMTETGDLRSFNVNMEIYTTLLNLKYKVGREDETIASESTATTTAIDPSENLESAEVD